MTVRGPKPTEAANLLACLGQPQAAEPAGALSLFAAYPFLSNT